MICFDAFCRFGPRPNAHGREPWTLQHLIEELDHCSISAAMVASTLQLGYDAMRENRRLVDELAPYDWLHPLWNVFPHWTGETPEPAPFMALMRRHGVRAVTLCPKSNGWSLRSRTSRPLLAELEQARVPVVLSQGSESLEADTIEWLLEEHPQLPVILREVGWRHARLIIPLVRRYPSLHLAFDHCQIHRGLEWLVEQGCEDQLIFASHAPTMSAGAHRFTIDYAEIPDAARRKIASGNLLRLLGDLPEPAPRENRGEDPIMAEARQGKPLSPLVLDIHAHVLDEGLDGGGGVNFMHDGGPQGIRKLARRMGVDGIGVMSWHGTIACAAAEGNRTVQAALDSEDDFFWGLGTFDVIHDSPEAMRASMEALFSDRRFLGLKPYPSYGIPYDDPRYDVWWQFGHERKLYCGIHPTKWYETEEFHSICGRFEDLTVIAYHCGGSYDVADAAIELARKYPNFYAEITLTPVCGGIIDYLVEGCGPQRVLYGSDMPMRDPRQQLGWVVYSRLPVEQKMAVLGGNTRRILERVRAAQREG